jgi:hypothetical protein
MGKRYQFASRYRLGEVLTKKMHKLFLAKCDLAEPRMVTAKECEACPHGSVIDRRTRVICGGEVKFFTTPCYFDLRCAATVMDCERCQHGEVGEDRLRSFCSRL